MYVVLPSFEFLEFISREFVQPLRIEMKIYLPSQIHRQNIFATFHNCLLVRLKSKDKKSKFLYTTQIVPVH